MDNINAPQSGNAPQGGNASQGGDQSGSNQPPDQNNAPSDGGQPPEGPAPDQGASQAPDSGGDKLQMPPDVGESAGDQPSVGASEQQPAGPPGPDPAAEAPASGDQGPVEDVFEGTEGGSPAPDQAAPAQDMGTQPPDQQPVPEGQVPGPAPEGQEMGPAPEMGVEAPPGEASGGEDGGTVPQSQPDFADPNQGQVPGQQMQAPGQQGGGSKLLIVLVIILLLLLVGAGVAYFLGYLPVPFLDNLLGRNQEATEEITEPEQEAEESLYPEDDQRKSDLVRIKSGLEDYFEANQAYPIAKSLENISQSTSSVYEALVPNYLTTMPSDPALPTKYYGYQSADGTSFELSASLDNEEDNDGVQRGDLILYILTNVSEVEDTAEVS